MTTINLAEFGFREIELAGQLLLAYSKKSNNHPYFDGLQVQLMMNKFSGNVFLTDEDYNVLMLNGDSLEGFYNSPYEGHEGFFNELIIDWNEDWHIEDSEWLYNLAKDLNELEALPKELLTLINK
jgi:hypothetical protein